MAILKNFHLFVGTFHEDKSIFRSYSETKSNSMRFNAERTAIEIEFLYENSNYKLWLKQENVSKVFYDDSNYDLFYIKIRRRYETLKQIKRPGEIVWNYSINPLLSSRDEAVVMSYVIPHAQVLMVYAKGNGRNARWLMDQIQAESKSISCRCIQGNDLNRIYDEILFSLPWKLRYSIMILLTNKLMKLDQLTLTTIQTLSGFKSSYLILEALFYKKIPFSIAAYNEILEDSDSYSAHLPSSNHAPARKLIITPSSTIFLPQYIDITNRVLRHFLKKGTHRFLRISFTNESDEKSIWKYEHGILARFRDSLENLNILGKRYSFLAYSNSQVRTHSCWMLEISSKLTYSMVSNWMGRFNMIRNPSKLGSRMGLCFSCTIPVKKLAKEDIIEVSDYCTQDLKYVFSDGIGSISYELLQDAISKLQLDTHTKISAVQIRIQGYKGVLALDPSLTGNSITLRPSMQKFSSDYRVLEICNYAAYRPGYINRQIIILLNGLGIPDDTFIRLQDNMLADLRNIFISKQQALKFVRKVCEAEIHKHILQMLKSDLISLDTEPYLKGVLRAFYSSAIREVRTRSKIIVPKSALLMGVIDEYGVLEYGQVFIKKLYYKSDKIITGRVVVTKNPCFHPGDIRVLEAIDRPELHHLVNVIVFPRKGPRPHTNEISGSDLDGDLYFVSWNSLIIPPNTYPPQSHFNIPEKQQDNIDKSHVIAFFLDYMKYDSLGVIANAQLVFMDKYGIFDPRSLKLAELQTIAVDYPKHGMPVRLQPAYQITVWPDFMEKINGIPYQSTSVLGKLYRNSKRQEFDLGYFGNASEIDMNSDILIEGYQRYLDEAARYYEFYDSSLRKWMRQCCVSDEYNLIIGEIDSSKSHKFRSESHDKVLLDLKYLRNQLKSLFCKSFKHNSDPIEIRAKASAWYFYAYSQRGRFYSFGWIVSEFLLPKNSKERRVRRD
jgi:RNA-dependent RNA polymerase